MTSSSSSSSSSSDELDDLAAAVREKPDDPALMLLWRALFALQHWWLLPTGDAADPRPMIGTAGEQRFLLAFTSEHRVTEFACREGGRTPGDIAAMSITPVALTGLGSALRKQGIDSILFDQGVHSFLAPIAVLESLSARFSAGPPDGPTG